MLALSESPRPDRRALGIVVAAGAAFPGVYAAVSAATGESAGALTAGLILLTGWLLGLRAGIGAGVVAPLASAGLSHAVLDATVSRDLYVLAAGLVLGPLLGGAAGHLRDVLRRNRAQIDELRAAHAAAANTEARWRAVVEHAPCVISTCDRDGTITFINRTRSGIPPSAMVGRSSFEFFPAEGRAQAEESLRRVYDLGETVDSRVEVIHGDGRPGVYRSRMAPIYRDGRITSSVNISTDFTPADELAEMRSRLLEQLIDAREEERRRLGRELHDGIGQALSSVLIGLGRLGDGPAPATGSPTREDLVAITRATLDDLHRMSRGLHPTVLDDIGLTAALERHAQELQRLHGITTDLQLIGSETQRLPRQLELAIYRIVQEGLHNVVRHAAARSASVVLELGRGAVNVIIEDDGRGCEVDNRSGLPRNAGLGLIGIRERAATLGGSATMESAPGAGTTLYVRLPVLAAPAAAPT